jgi:hypothetical protein
MKLIGFFLAQVTIKHHFRISKLLFHAGLQKILSAVSRQFSDLQRSLSIMNDNLKSTNICSFQLKAEDKNGATSTRRKALVPQADLT